MSVPNYSYKSKYLVFLLGLSAHLALATPQGLKIDGSLFDNAGVPLTTNRDMKIYAYAASTGGSSLWSSSVYNVAVTSGRFSIIVDASSGSPSLMSRFSALADSGTIWFEIEVDTGTAGNGVINTSNIVKTRYRAKGAMFALSAASADRLRGVTVSSTTPADGQVLAYNSTAVQWEPQYAAGKDATYPTEAARRSTAAMAIYVRTDGNDSTCNGSADAAAASAPACSFATPQKAVDSIPDIVLHAVTVNVAAGTYRASTSGTKVITLQKSFGGSGSLLIQGSGAVIFSGATSGAPTTPVGAYGVDVYAPTTRAFTLKNISTQYFAGSGIRLNPHSAGVLESVSASSNTGSGVEATSAYLEATGSNAFGSGNAYGLYLTKSQLALTGTGTITANSNTSYGVYIALESQMYGINGTTVTASSNGGGVLVTSNSFFYPDTLVASSNTTTSGLTVTNGSHVYCDTNGSFVTSSNAVYGVGVATASSAFLECPLTANSNTVAQLGTSYSSNTTFQNNAVSMSGAPSASGIYVSDSSNLSIWGTAALTLARGSLGAGVGMIFDSNSQFSTTTSGAISITQFQTYGVSVLNGSRFVDAGAGTRTISNAGTAANITELSLYRKGGFAAGTCDGSSRCN